MASTISITIRLAKSVDASVLAEMSRTLIEDGLPWRWRPGRVLHSIREPEATVIVAEVDRQIAGFAILSFSARTAHLNLFAVLPVYRRSGVARALLGWLIESCQIAGMSMINLEVRQKNSGAIAFYQGQGFTSVGHRRGYYEGKEGATLMNRRLIPEALERRRPQ